MTLGDAVWMWVLLGLLAHGFVYEALRKSPTEGIGDRYPPSAIVVAFAAAWLAGPLVVLGFLLYGLWLVIRWSGRLCRSLWSWMGNMRNPFTWLASGAKFWWRLVFGYPRNKDVPPPRDGPFR